MVLAVASCGSDGNGADSPPTASGSSSQPPPQTSSPKGTLAGKVIVVDPGHNGSNGEHPEVINKKVDIVNGRKACNTTGTATADGYNEHAFTWDVSTRLVKILRAKGAKVVLTRKTDNGVGPCINERAQIGNKAKADAVLSVHADGAPKPEHGFHIITPKGIKGYNEQIVAPSRKLGLAVRDAFRRGTGIPYSTYRGKSAIDPRDDLGGLNVSKVPAVFIECGNMKNPGEAARMKNAAFRERMARALAEGLTSYVNS